MGINEVAGGRVALHCFGARRRPAPRPVIHYAEYVCGQRRLGTSGPGSTLSQKVFNVALYEFDKGGAP